MIPHETIETFGKLWLQGISFSLLFIIGSIIIGIKLNQKKSILFGKILGSISLFRWIFIQIYSYCNGTWVIESNLPIQMCSFSSLFCGLVMFFPNKTNYEFIYYIGITSAIHALITPVFTMGSSGYFIFDYYLNHSLIALIPLYITFVYNKYPSKLSWLRTFYYSHIFMLVGALANVLLDSNYMYLSEKPIANNPFILGEWPWYILGFQFAGILHFLILYSPFYKMNKK